MSGKGKVKKEKSHKTPTFWLGVECAVLFLVLPAVLYIHPTRWNVHLGLWAVTLYALPVLRRSKGFSWRKLWHGRGWPASQRKTAMLLFGVAVLTVIGLTLWLVPQRLFAFPMQRPFFWLLVMVLYPILSVLPQELVFRAFFFRRYESLFGSDRALIIASAFVFGFVHIVFGNAVSPILSMLGGAVFAYGYTQHRSLKWVALEHAAYGCMVFTVGLGQYFLVGGLRP
ncbi:MAG: type II CAAX endopeptidase family protein [Alphaproteobacteria bacterium]|nr:type II CAAX endopeptidase family protein [Alphaproteobacteria bacterium]